LNVAIDDFFAGLDPAQQRETTINWPGLVQRVIDDYQQHTTLTHGVQKDAIQNSWDARTSRRHGSGWACSFHLHIGSSDRRYLAITDKGTHGLTGRVLSSEEYFANLPEEERWARFESLAFTHPEGASEGQLGARGQGKFIFVGASNKRRMLYDTLRADGVYRLGLRTVEQTRSPVYYWEGAAARSQLAAYDPSLERLTEIGTRVIIDDPVDEVVNAILDGTFDRHIAETWWPIVTKLNASISVVVTSDGLPPETRMISPPVEVELPDDDNTRYDVWRRENVRLDYQGDAHSIKRLHVVRDKRGPVADDVVGVALIRGGMKVMSLPMRHVPAELGRSVYGYIEFDRDLDAEMKRLESPTHYSFDLGRGIGRKVKTWIEDELERFAREKLGQGADPRAADAERHREAERRALAAINKAARALGILGKKGPAGGKKPGPGGSDNQPLGAVVIPPVFDSGTRRVNHGEAFDAAAFAKSRLGASAHCRLSLYITRGDVLVLSLGEKTLKLDGGAESEVVRSGGVTFSADQHGPGEYALRAKVTLLDEADGLLKGHEHKTAYRFWLEQDPPELGIFEDIEGLDYGARPIDAEAVPSDGGGWKFQYNTSHPAKRREDLSEDTLFDYLLRLMARELVFVDLRSDEPTQFDAADLEQPDELYRKSATVIGRILYDYYA
jgi:hypothetical protein